MPVGSFCASCLPLRDFVPEGGNVNEISWLMRCISGKISIVNEMSEVDKIDDFAEIDEIAKLDKVDDVDEVDEFDEIDVAESVPRFTRSTR